MSRPRAAASQLTSTSRAAPRPPRRATASRRRPSRGGSATTSVGSRGRPAAPTSRGRPRPRWRRGRPGCARRRPPTAPTARPRSPVSADAEQARRTDRRRRRRRPAVPATVACSPAASVTAATRASAPSGRVWKNERRRDPPAAPADVLVHHRPPPDPHAPGHASTLRRRGRGHASRSPVAAEQRSTASSAPGKRASASSACSSGWATRQWSTGRTSWRAGARQPEAAVVHGGAHRRAEAGGRQRRARRSTAGIGQPADAPRASTTIACFRRALFARARRAATRSRRSRRRRRGTAARPGRRAATDLDHLGRGRSPAARR